MKTEFDNRCCDNGFNVNAVYWNPHNGVVQCHCCGHVYVKASKLKYILNRIFRWW